MAEEPFIHIDQAPQHWAISEHGSDSSGEHVLLYAPVVAMYDVLFDKLNLDRDEAFILFRDLFIDGTREFWFSLCFVGGYMRWIPKNRNCESDFLPTAQKCFIQAMRWWPRFCERNDRFRSAGKTIGWPAWGISYDILEIFNWPISFEDRKRMDCWTAGKRFMELWEHDQASLEGGPNTL